jgi:hypothetical protein
MGNRETRREDGAVEQGREKTHTTRRTLYLPALIVAAVLVACAVALLAVEQKAEATFPGKNGGMAYNGDGQGRHAQAGPGNKLPGQAPGGRLLPAPGRQALLA